MKLHTYGLLRDSFRLGEKMEGVWTIWRLRDRHVKDASRAVQHMQKALTKMNIQLANAISNADNAEQPRKVVVCSFGRKQRGFHLFFRSSVSGSWDPTEQHSTQAAESFWRALPFNNRSLTL